MNDVARLEPVLPTQERAAELDAGDGHTAGAAPALLPVEDGGVHDDPTRARTPGAPRARDAGQLPGRDDHGEEDEDEDENDDESEVEDDDERDADAREEAAEIEGEDQDEDEGRRDRVRS